ncbi:MAG: glycerophosphodiester phosphodiesterase family protein [Actinomycetota bacterium]
MEAAHDRCLDLHPYTVNEVADMERLLSLGVVGRFTNFPNRLDKLLGGTAAGKDTGSQKASVAHAECQAS